MKKYLLLYFILLFGSAASAQTRKFTGNFSQIRSYYNPAFTTEQGSRLTGLYRNQWTGFEDAPKTIYAAAELDALSFKKSKGYNLQNQSEQGNSMKHGFGLQLLRESFGPHTETQVGLTYGAGIRLSEHLHLRWGGGLFYTSLGLDGNKLTVDQESDPKYTRLLGQSNRSGNLDLNLGIGLAGANFYAGYAMQGITEGSLLSTGDEYMQDFFARRHIGQAGYRFALGPDLGLILNTIYQQDEHHDATLEGQLKGVYQNMFWAGAGYRNDYALTATAGIKLNKLELSYLYETPVADARIIDQPTNEVTLSYLLHTKRHQPQSQRRQLSIW